METTGSKLTDMPDETLVKHAIEQNQAAFIILYTRYNAGVRSHISRYVSQKEDIEDICLESIIRDKSTDFGQYSLGRKIKRELIARELL